MLYLVIGLALLALLAWRDLLAGLSLGVLFLPTYAIRFNFFGIPTTLLELIIYTIFIIWLIKLLRGQASFNYLIIKPYIVPIGLILVGGLIGVVVSTDKLISLGILKGWFVDPLLLFVVVVNTLRHRNNLRMILAALIASGVGLSLWALYQVATNEFITIDHRASAFFTSANYLALYLVPLIILAAGLCFTVAGMKKLAALGAFILMLAAIYFTFSYSGWLAVILGLGVLAWLILPKAPTLLVTVGALGIAVLSQVNHPKFKQMLDLVGQSSSHSRLQIWQTAWLMIRAHPLAGIGLGLFEKEYPKFVQQLFSNPFEPKVLHAHNLWLHTWINLGLTGIIGFIFLLIVFFKQTINTFKQLPDVLTGSLISAMVALLIHGLLDTPYWKNDLSVLFWLLIAFSIVLSNHHTIYQTNHVSYRN